jgi:predicted ATPase
VGRERELREVQQRLQQTRLLTLTGPGGIGKTRLSLQAAAEAASGFRDGVVFVALEQIRDPGLLVPTIIAALALPVRVTEPLSTLRQYLSSRQLLLVLDNFEQLLSARTLVTELLREAPELKVLLTSRAALHVYGEQEYPVPSLGLPGAQRVRPTVSTSAGTERTAAVSVNMAQIAASEAVTLFVARGTAVRPDFALTPHNAATVAEIAARLDGLPLAIELAAARLKIMTPEAMVARLSSRLTLLTSGARDLPDRMQTLRGTISWSYELLEPRVQRLFARLAVFHGGACLTELEFVCRPLEELGLDTLDGLTTLVDHSLLKQAQAGEEPRFTMLETIREFAYAVLEQSGELELLLERHSEAFLILAQTARPHLTRTGRLFWVGRERAARALKLSGGQVSERIAALSAAGSLAYWQTDSRTADRAFREAVDLARQLGDGKTIALTLYDYGFAALIGGDKDQALTLVKEGLALARKVGDPVVLAELLCALGTLHWRLGNLEAAAPPLEEAVQLLTGSEAANLLEWAHGIRGQVRLSRGDLTGAREDFRAAEPYTDKEDLGHIMLLLFSFARIALAKADLERALRLAGAAIANRERSQILVAAEQNLAAVFEPAAARIGKQRAEELMAEGRLMSAKEALDYGMQAPATDESP